MPVGRDQEEEPSWEPSKGKRMLGHLFTRGQGGPPREAARPRHTKTRQDAERGRLRPREPRATQAAFTHLYAHVCSHTHALTAHSCTHLSSHIPTLRCICAHGARTYVHTHTRACMHTHSFSHRHVLISGSWLPFGGSSPQGYISP